MRATSGKTRQPSGTSAWFHPQRALALSMAVLVALALLGTAPVTATSHGLQRELAIPFQAGEDTARVAVAHPSAPFGYVGTDTAPGTVVKVDLDTMTRLSSLTLNAGEDHLASAVIDASGGYAYFGTDTQPGRIVKVHLDTMTRVGVLTLNAGEDHLTSAVVDATGSRAYFGTNTAPGRVVGVDLASFTRIGAVTLDLGEDHLTSAVIDPPGSYGFFGTDTAPGRIVRVDLAALDRVDAIETNPGEDHLTAAVAQPGGSHAYFGTNTAPGRVVTIELKEFTQVGDSLVLNTNEDGLTSAVADANNPYLYFGTATAPGRVVKIDTTPGSPDRVGAITLPSGASTLLSAMTDPAGDHAFFGTDTSPARIAKIDLGAFAHVDTLALARQEGPPGPGVIDPSGDYAYYGLNDTNPSRIVKVDLATSARVGTITLNAGEHRLTSAVIDPAGAYAYFGTSFSIGLTHYPGRVVKVDLTTFTRVGAITFPTGENGAVAAVIDPAGAFAYFATTTHPTQVVKVDLATFSRVGAITLDSDEGWATATMIDPAGDHAYVATFLQPKLVKVDLTTFARVDAVALPGSLPYSGVVAPAGDHAYLGFVAGGAPGGVLKIDLGTFAHVDTLSFHAGEDQPVGAAIAPSGSHVYFAVRSQASSPPPGRVVRVNADTLTRVDSITLDAGEVPSFASTLLRPSGHHLYIGVETDPGRAVKVNVAGSTPPQPPLPTGLTAAAASKQVHLSWTPGSAVQAAGTAWAATSDDGDGPVSHYRVQQSTDGASWTTVDKPTEAELTITDLEGGVTYHFRVRAEGPGGGSEWGGPVSATPRAGPDLVSDGEVVRLAGADRFATGAEASAQLWPDGATTVVVATGLDYPDALAGGAVAAVRDAPLLLAATDHLPVAVRDELVRLAPERVILLGGPGALSDAVEQELAGLPSRPQVERVAGAHRFETAERAATAAGRDGQGDVVVATGLDYPDALSAGSLTAGSPAVPVTLATRDRLMSELGPGERALLIGGEAVLSAALEDAARVQARDVARLSGGQRFATSMAVADFALRHRLTDPGPLVVATGQNYPDALSAGAITARTGGPLLLIPRDGPTAAQAEWISANRDRFTGAIVMGGSGAVSDAGVQSLRDLLDA